MSDDRPELTAKSAIETALCVSDESIEVTVEIVPARSEPAEKLRVVLMVETDFVWHEPSKAFMPVLGSTHGSRAIEARARRPLALPQRPK